MNDFEGLLNTDYGFKPSGKSAPMSGSASTKGSTNINSNFDLGSLGQSRSTRTSNSLNGSVPDNRDSIFGQPSSKKSQDFSGLDDILGGSTRHSRKSETRGVDEAFNFDSMFGSSRDTGAKSSMNSEPVFDKPVYDDDDDIFDGVPGLKSSSSKIKYDDVFSSVSSSPPKGSSAFDDLLGGFGRSNPQSKSFGAKGSETGKAVADFDDLLPGFGGSTPSTQRSGSGVNFTSENTINVTKSKSNVMDNPSVPTGDFSDPLEEINKLSSSGSLKKDHSVDNGVIFDDTDPFGDLGKSIPAFSSEMNSRGKERSTERAYSSTSGNKTFSSSKEPVEKPSVRSPDSQSQKKVPVDNDWGSRHTMSDMPTVSTDSHKHTSQSMTPPSYESHSFKDENMQGDRSTRYEENLDSSEDVWLTVSEIPLFTQPTTAAPPSRPPPPRPVQISKAGSSSPAFANAKRKANEFSYFPNSSQNSHIPKSAPVSSSQIDDLEDFTTGRSRNNVGEHGNGLADEELEMNSAAAAMKEAMDRAEAKFRHAKEVRGREGAKAARSMETQVDKEERWDREQLSREREEEEIEQRKLEREREREEEERELRRLEKERERAREIEREREKARQAVERATREARERAATEARLRAERAKAEKAAVERANAEARERAERAAVQRAQAEARVRAAAEARERAEKAAADRANAEAKEREARERAAAAKAEADPRARAEQRAAVERAAAEARERAVAEARERAAAAARASQQKNENDLESFFAMGRASSAPRPRENSSSKQQAETPKASSVSSSNMRKTDDLSSIFGAAPSSGDFQEVEGETEERRRARLERHQRTHERAARALAEKNERDLQNQRDQVERHRIGETIDAEIKRWAAGKEGNLRSLLSTLQYVLWPECGWQPVSLTDMITAASVKKAYRKATLCIHPDKVQQKGANLQQKYVAEKVFDLLKEAWNKFNSEELF